MRRSLKRVSNHQRITSPARIYKYVNSKIRIFVTDTPFVDEILAMANVKIYTTPSCVYCKMTKAFFAQNNVEYEEKNVAVDAQAREEMIQKSGQMGVPVVEIDGKIIIGFDQPRLREALGLQ